MTAADLRLLTPDWRDVADLETPFVAVFPDPSQLIVKLGVSKQAIAKIVDDGAAIATAIGEQSIDRLVQLHAARSQLVNS